ncbi:MAG: beta-propeller domain-containing protein [Deltaproteobacteria bacterium]|nr:beta-propeller domain-containing protein [Deltaproteobacteria bacterium]
MKTVRGCMTIAAWAVLYAVQAVGCSNDDNAGSPQGESGGTIANQGESGSGGAGSGGTEEVGPAGTSGVAGTNSRIEGSSGASGAGTGGVSGSNAGDEGIIEAPVTGKSLSALKKVINCDDVLAKIKQRLSQEAEEKLQANLEQTLTGIRNGNTCRYWGIADAGVDYTGLSNGGAGGGAAAPSSEEQGASEYSTTNVQVVGVDEADFVKNDDNYIYIVADGKLQIIDAWPASQTKTIASVEVRGTPNKLYVENNRAVVYASLDLIDQGGSTPRDDIYMPIVSDDGYQKECTHGYNCDFSGDGRKLLIRTYDISDKTKPVLLRETEISGSYINSRRIGDIVHTVATFPEIAVSDLVYWPEELESYYSNCWNVDEFPYTEDEVRDMFAELDEQNQKTIDEATIANFLPGIKDTRYIGGTPTVEEGLLNSCDNFYVSQEGDGRGFLSLISFDMSALGEIGATTVVGKPGAVYASDDALYVAVRHYSSMMRGWYFEDSESIDEATTIHKFKLTPDDIKTLYAGSGVAKGRILNQFSMDEKDGYLRIAASNGQVPNPNVHSTLSVLKQTDDGLQVVGILDDIAPTEDIRSVRFNGDVGFIVTFKKTDPLFVIDLSDPTAPVIKGELKVPGYATYMHLMDKTHLLTMGYNADDVGSFAWFQGLQLRVLDVSQLDDPKVLSEETIGTRGSSSDAATNHLAFNYFPQRDLLALPMTICEGGPGGGTYGDIMTFSGLLVYRVTLQDGFELIGGVPHEAPETASNYGSGCSNWWTDSNSKVKRSIFMSSESEDFVYSIALDLINVSNLTDLEHPLTSVELTDSP